MPGTTDRGNFSHLFQPSIKQLESQAFSNETLVMSEFFGDGALRDGEVEMDGASEIRWLNILGRSIAGGARYPTEFLPSERRTYGAGVNTAEIRHAIPIDWQGEPFAWYFAEIETDIATEDSGPLGKHAMRNAERSSAMQKRAAEMLVKKMLSWHFFGPVTNALAIVETPGGGNGGAAGDTFFTARRNATIATTGNRGAYCLGRGCPVSVVDPGTGAARGGAGYQILSVVPAAAGDRVNLDRAIPVGGDFQAGDAVCEGDVSSNSFGRGLTPLQAMVGNAADSEMIHGRSRIDYPQLNAVVVNNAAATQFRAPTLALIEQALMHARARSDWDEEPYVAVMPPGAAAEFLFAGARAAGGGVAPAPPLPNVGEAPAQDLVQYTQGVEVIYGFSAFRIACPSAPGGTITVMADADVTPNHIFLIKRGAFRKWVLKRAGWGEGTLFGGTGHRIPNFYRGYSTFSAALCITCHDLPKMIVIKQVGHQNILVAQGGEGAMVGAIT